MVFKSSQHHLRQGSTIIGSGPLITHYLCIKYYLIILQVKKSIRNLRITLTLCNLRDPNILNFSPSLIMMSMWDNSDVDPKRLNRFQLVLQLPSSWIITSLIITLHVIDSLSSGFRLKSPGGGEDSIMGAPSPTRAIPRKKNYLQGGAKLCSRDAMGAVPPSPFLNYATGYHLLSWKPSHPSSSAWQAIVRNPWLDIVWSIWN